WPPLTGASRNRTPRAAAASATLRAVSGRMVLMSISSRPSRAASRTPCSPRTTASTSGESGTMVMTTSAPSATSAAEAPALAPGSTSARTGCGARVEGAEGACGPLAARAPALAPRLDQGPDRVRGAVVDGDLVAGPDQVL